GDRVGAGGQSIYGRPIYLPAADRLLYHFGVGWVGTGAKVGVETQIGDWVRRADAACSNSAIISPGSLVAEYRDLVRPLSQCDQNQFRRAQHFGSLARAEPTIR